MERLYEICEISREILQGNHAVARVIARPFVGKNKDDFVRTRYRRDFSLKPTGETLLKKLYKSHIPTIAIGKINDLYNGDGIGESLQTKSNFEGMQALFDSLNTFQNGLIMANLVDFDMLWGHRNDTAGFKQGLEQFDIWLGGFLEKLMQDDILIITSDHGNDPTTESTDHSREYVPILITGTKIRKGFNLGIRKSFADCQATLAEYFSVKKTPWCESFLQLIYQ